MSPIDKLFDLWFSHHPPTEEQLAVYAEISEAESQAKVRLAEALCIGEKLAGSADYAKRHGEVNAAIRSFAETISKHADALFQTAFSRASILHGDRAAGQVAPMMLGISGYNMNDDLGEAFRHLRMARMLANLGIRDEAGRGRYLAMAKTEVEKARLCANAGIACGAKCLDMNTSSS